MSFHLTSRRLPVFSSFTGWLLVFVALGTHLAFIHFMGTGDVGLWLRWMYYFHEHGLRLGYEMSNEVLQCYPPGTFALLGMAYQIFGAALGKFVLLKMILLISVIAGAVVYGCWSRNVVLTAVLIFAMVLSTTLGYLDALLLAPLLLSLWALQKQRLALASFFFTVAVLLKPQPLIIAPFFLVYACDLSITNLRSYPIWLPRMGRLLLGAFAPVVLSLLLVNPAAIADSLAMAVSHEALSYQGLNPNWVVQLMLYVAHAGDTKHFFMVDAPANLLLLVKFLFYACYFFVLGVFMLRRRSFEEFAWFACIGFYSYFLLYLGVHENHLFIAMVLAFVIYQSDTRVGLPLVSYFAVMANLNLLLFYGIEGNRILFSGMQGVGFFAGTNLVAASVVFSIINAVFGLLCLWHVVRMASSDFR